MILITTEIFIKRARAIHGDKYDYRKTVYKSINERVVITCPVHGDFEKIASHHLYRKVGCVKCKPNPTGKEHFVKKSIDVFGKDAFDYSLITDYHSQEKQKLICRKHGLVFEQLPNNHYKGKRSCPECKRKIRKESCKNNGGWSHGHWASIKGEHKVYAILCEMDGERFVKIGKTLNPIVKRFNKGAGKTLPYNYKTIFVIKSGYKPRELSILEKKIHSELKGWSYTPRRKFHGSTECFSINVLRTKLIRDLRKKSE